MMNKKNEKNKMDEIYIEGTSGYNRKPVLSILMKVANNDIIINI
jgi:hypothetical protein